MSTDEHVGTKSEASQARRDQRATYSVHEAAALLGLCPTTTYKLIREGRIPALRMGGRWIVPKRRFHAWLDSQATEEVAL